MPIADTTRIELHGAQRNAPHRARLRRAPGLGPLSAVTIALDSRRNGWRLGVHVELKEASTWRVGEILVPVPLNPAEGTRVVAVACCPGAVGWAVDAQPYQGAQPYAAADVTEVGHLEIGAADVGMLAPGIHVVGRAELVGARRNYVGDLLAPGNTQITIGPERLIQRVSAWQVGAGGVFGIEAGLAVPIPPNGAASVAVDRYGTDAGAVWFAAIPAGGGGYVIEFLE